MRTRFPIVYSVCNVLRRDFRLALLRRRGATDAASVFSHYFRHNLFGDPESLSGTGSTLRATESIRAALPGLFARIGASSVLDIPCGDFNWASALDWSAVDYTGADVVADLVERNRRLHAAACRSFVVLDILKDELPTCDVVLCRDLFIHFPNALVRKAIENIKRSGSRYLLTTHYRKARRNREIALGSFRPVNLTRPPFGFPEPEQVIADDDYVKLWGRTLSLWKIADLP